MAGRPKSSADRRAAVVWAAYLNRALAVRGWQQVDLIRAAGRDAEGKQILSSGRVSQWVNAKEAASPDYAVIVANALGEPVGEALKATAAVETTGDETESARGATSRSLEENDEAFIVRLRASPDPEMHELANLFERDLERVRRMARREFDELERRRAAENPDVADEDGHVNKSA